MDLHAVARSGDGEKAQQLISEGADVNEKDKLNRTPYPHTFPTSDYVYRSQVDGVNRGKSCTVNCAQRHHKDKIGRT